MYILAIETSSKIGSVACGIDNRVIAKKDFTATAKHAAELIPTADRVINAVGIEPEDINVICVSWGPGSFTGLRVGFSFARAFAQITGAKLSAIPTTDVVIENIKNSLPEGKKVFITPIIDAKRGQVFSAGYRWEKGKIEKIINDCVISPKDLIRKISRPLWVLGEGLEFHNEHFSSEGITILDRKFWSPHAENVYKIGWEYINQQKFTPIDAFVPNYIRLPEAEEKWQMKVKDMKGN